MKPCAECFCVSAAALKSLSARRAIEAKSIASDPVHKKRAARSNGKHGDAIRQLRAVALCTPIEIAVTAHEGVA